MIARLALRSVCALLLAALLAASAAGLTLHQEASAPAAAHVVLISIDGLRPELYLDPSWPAPTLQQMARDGVRAARVRGVFPTVTYPSHTTMVTGAWPSRHGIYYNTPFEPGGQTGRWYWEYEGIGVPTLWSAVKAAGGTSASLSWPVTVGAPIDWNVPEFWSLEEGYGAVRPVREASTPGLFEELEREAVGRLTELDISGDWLTREAGTASMAAYLIETYRPTLTTVHLVGLDHFSHADGRDSDRVRRAVGAVDAAVREIADSLERAGIADRAAVIVTGDHGFIDVHTALAPNVWLAQAGLMEASRDRGDWRATFHTASASAFLHLRDPADREAVARVEALLAALPDRLRRLFRVVGREELDALGADPAAALALAPVPGISMTAAASGPVLRRVSGGNHGFHPGEPQIHTGLVAIGAGLARGVEIPEMSLADVAPTVAALLGLDLPALDGNLLPGLLTR